MLKITNFQNNCYQNRVFKAKQPEFVVSTCPIEKSPISISNACYQPISFGKKIEQGKYIASNLNTIIKNNRGAIGTPEFQKELSKINTKNVVQTIKSYKKENEKSLFADVLKETASSKDERQKAVLQVFDVLAKKGDENGVQSSHYKKNFEKELNKQMESILPAQPTKLNRITLGLIQAIDNKSSLSAEEKLAIKTAKPETLQNYTVKALDKTVNVAEKSFQKQINHDGLFAKFADDVSALWNSKNRKELVQADIETYKKQVKTLKDSKTNEEFKSKFKEIFNVDYDPELIATYQNKEVELKTALIATGVENSFKTRMADLLTDKPLEGKVEIIQTANRPYVNVLETEEQVYQKNYDVFVEYLGKGDKEVGKKELEKKFKEYKLTETSTDSEKFTVMQKIANKKAIGLHNETKMVMKNKDIEEIKKEYKASYNATFGLDNDIAKRVTDYNISQQIGEYATDSLVMGALMVGIGLATAGVGILPAVKGAAVATGANMAVYSADRLASKNGMTKEDITEILKFSALDGATFIGSALAYQGIKFFTSAAFNATNTATKITEMALLTTAETAMDSAVTKAVYSEVEIEGIPYSATFSLAGQLLELKLL